MGGMEWGNFQCPGALMSLPVIPEMTLPVRPLLTVSLSLLMLATLAGTGVRCNTVMCVTGSPQAVLPCVVPSLEQDYSICREALAGDGGTPAFGGLFPAAGQLAGGGNSAPKQGHLMQCPRCNDVTRK